VAEILERIPEDPEPLGCAPANLPAQRSPTRAGRIPQSAFNFLVTQDSNISSEGLLAIGKDDGTLHVTNLPREETRRGVQNIT